MTYPAAPGGLNAPARNGQTPVHVGVASDPILGVLAPSTFTIPFPSGTVPRGPLPLDYPFVVIINSTPWELVISQGGVLTQIAAFTQDVVRIPNWEPNVVLSVTANAGGASVAPGHDSAVYATWYPADPGGQYPAAIGAGAIPIGTGTLLDFQPLGGAFGTLQGSTLGAFPSWCQAVTITGGVVSGPGLGVNVIVTNAATGGLLCETVLNNGQQLMVPCYGQDVTVTLVAVGATTLNNWFLYGMVGPVLAPFIPTVGGGTGFGFNTGASQVNVNVLAGAVTNIIPAPPLGYQIRLRSWSIHFNAAPVAGTQVLLRPTAAAIPIIRADLAGTIQQDDFPVALDLWIPDQQGTGVNIPDGVDAQNTTAQACVFTVGYEIWPTNLQPV